MSKLTQRKSLDYVKKEFKLKKGVDNLRRDFEQLAMPIRFHSYYGKFLEACNEHNKTAISPFSLHKISDLIETVIGHLWWILTDVPPQPNSQPMNVLVMVFVPK